MEEEEIYEGEEEKEKQKFHKPYKVMEGDCVFVRRNDIVSKSGVPYTFYSINIQSKNNKGEKEQFKKEIQFKQGVSVEDNTKIKIISMFEKVRNDPHTKYYPVWGLFINEFEIIDEPNYYEMQNEVENYQNVGANAEIDEDGLVEVNW